VPYHSHVATRTSGGVKYQRLTLDSIDGVVRDLEP
jgi:hypothetical protein